LRAGGSALIRLPSEQLNPLLAAYAEVRGAERRRIALGGLVLLALTLLSGWVAQVSPGLIWDKGHNFFGYFQRLFTLEQGDRAGQPVWTDPGEWFWGLGSWLDLLGDTLRMAYTGTLLGATGGLLFGLVAASNTVPNRWVRGAAKRFLEFCRTVPEIVFALVFVIAFGLGPLPGVLALAIHSLGALGKMVSELVENIDMKPVEGLQATGASWPQMARFAVVPQILPGFLGYALLRFEINVRGAAVLGFVGAGGIGQDLIEAVRKFYYNDVAALLVLIILTVFVIDTLTGFARRWLLEGRA